MRRKMIRLAVLVVLAALVFGLGYLSRPYIESSQNPDLPPELVKIASIIKEGELPEDHDKYFDTQVAASFPEEITSVDKDTRQRVVDAMLGSLEDKSKETENSREFVSFATDPEGTRFVAKFWLVLRNGRWVMSVREPE